MNLLKFFFKTKIYLPLWFAVTRLSGASNGTRTHNFSPMKRVLYQLSYTGIYLVPTTGLEPALNALEGRCLSIRLRGHKFTVEVCTPHLGTASKAGPCRLIRSRWIWILYEFLLVDTSADTPQSEREVRHYCELPIVTLFVVIKKR